MKSRRYLSNKVLIGTSMLFATAGLAGSALYADAYRGDPNVKGPNYTTERHEIMTKAFENNDYGVWKDSMAGRGRVTQVINENNFSQFAQAHKLALEGKTDEANEIRAELGLGLRNGAGQGQGQGQGRGMNRHK